MYELHISAKRELIEIEKFSHEGEACVRGWKLWRGGSVVTVYAPSGSMVLKLAH